MLISPFSGSVVQYGMCVGLSFWSWIHGPAIVQMIFYFCLFYFCLGLICFMSFLSYSTGIHIWHNQILSLIYYSFKVSNLSIFFSFVWCWSLLWFFFFFLVSGNISFHIRNSSLQEIPLGVFKCVFGGQRGETANIGSPVHWVLASFCAAMGDGTRLVQGDRGSDSLPLPSKALTCLISFLL